MTLDKISVKLIEYQSQEYQQACRLRYRLFFQEHDLPWDVVLDDNNTDCFFAAIVIEENVVAYGQLRDRHNGIYQIEQMVVEPKYQRQYLGKRIILTLIDLAKHKGAIEIVLNSRLCAIGFYQRVGFQTCGVEFPSPTTGVIHIPMNKKL